jgi:hypothetical protein
MIKVGIKSNMSEGFLGTVIKEDPNRTKQTSKN